jgi:hypothetical protein
LINNNMKNLDNIASALFQKIRGRFPSVTIGDENGEVTNMPESARFFDFAFESNGMDLGKVSISLDEKNGVVIVVGRDIVQNQMEDVQNRWYNFLKELRLFAKKRMMPFDVRDINKSNLNKRDYKFLATNRPGENTMAESRMYGTNKTSYQRIGNARLAIKHTQPINVESTGSRSQKIGAIYIESPEGERFKYPFRHLAGARAMARHVSEGGNAYDDFGKYVAGLSEEAVKLQKFKTYMNRSSVMAETLAGYMDTVNERIQAVKKEIHHLQKEAYYREATANFTVSVVEDVPDDVSENWIDQLTIKQFNEELKDVFPYIYKLVGEATKAKELGPEDLIDESGLQYYTGVKKHGKEYMKKAAQAGREGASQEELGRLKDKYSKAEKKTKEEFELEQAFEDTMGQFADHVCEDCGNLSWRTLSEEKQKGVDGKVCWKGYKRMGTKMKGGRRVDNCVKVKEADLDEAYIKTSKDAIDTLGALRKIGKSIELGQGSYDGNLAGMYVNDVYDVITWLQSNADTSDPKFKQIIAPVIELRKKAKSMETKPGSGKDARFGNEIVNTLYPLMQWIEMNGSNAKEGNAFANAVRQAKMSGKKKGDKIDGPDGKEVTLEKDYNFSPDDLAQLQKMNSVDDVKRRAIELISTKSRKPMKPEKVAWFKRAIASKRTPTDVIKLMYDLMLSGDGNAVIGSRGSMAGNSYRKTFGDDENETDFAPGADANNSPLSLTPEKPKTPIGEFILSYFDRETGKFPKGETAVLTAVQKEYGDNFVKPAAQFVKKVESLTIAKKAEEIQQSQYPETEMIKQLAGV